MAMHEFNLAYFVELEIGNVCCMIFTEDEALAETPTSNLNTPGTHTKARRGMQKRPTSLLTSFLLFAIE
jgi:hypothetical protein